MDRVKLYHEQPGVQLYHGDCREVAASIDMGAVGLVLADPPYGLAIQKANGSIGMSNVSEGRSAYLRSRGMVTKPARAYPSLCAGDGESFDPAWLLALGKPLILWGANHYADKLPPSAGWLIWDKREGQTSDNFADAEMAWSTFDMPARLFPHYWRGLVRKSEHGERLHPMQKPVALMKWCLSLWLKRGGAGAVFDPYAGSGPTARACLDLGVSYIGCDVEQWCCDTIVRHRLQQGALSLHAEATA